MRQQVSVKEAAELLNRGERRVYQLLESGDLGNGDFQGSVLLASVREFKRKIDNGMIRRGRPRLHKNGKKTA